MFNIVKRRDFMLADNLATKEEAEKIARDYGKDYIAVEVPVQDVRHIDYVSK